MKAKWALTSDKVFQSTPVNSAPVRMAAPVEMAAPARKAVSSEKGGVAKDGLQSTYGGVLCNFYNTNHRAAGSLSLRESCRRIPPSERKGLLRGRASARTGQCISTEPERETVVLNTVNTKKGGPGWEKARAESTARDGRQKESRPWLARSTPPVLSTETGPAVSLGGGGWPPRCCRSQPRLARLGLPPRSLQDGLQLRMQPIEALAGARA